MKLPITAKLAVCAAAVAITTLVSPATSVGAIHHSAPAAHSNNHKV